MFTWRHRSPWPPAWKRPHPPPTWTSASSPSTVWSSASRPLLGAAAVARQGPSKSCDFGTPSYLHWLDSCERACVQYHLVRLPQPVSFGLARGVVVFVMLILCCSSMSCWFSVVPCGTILLAAVVAVVVQIFFIQIPKIPLKFGTK